jgi:hypothetical protein
MFENSLSPDNLVLVSRDRHTVNTQVHVFPNRIGFLVLENLAESPISLTDKGIHEV